MRDPKRIQKFCDELAQMWRTVPDWRFGQLISNVLGAYVSETHRDIFFPEEEEMLAFFKKYFYGINNQNIPSCCAFCHSIAATPESPICSENGRSLADVMLDQRPDWCPKTQEV